MVFMKLIIFLVIICSLNCSSPSQKPDIFDPTLLEESWNNNRKGVVSSWIRSLNDTTLPDDNFFSRVAYLSTTTNFVFGNVNASDSSWHTKNMFLKKIARQNIATAYNRYLNSCLFFNKAVTWEHTLFLQEEFYNADRILTNEEVDQLDKKIVHICDIISNKQNVISHK
jgi:hypothetical protein